MTRLPVPYRAAGPNAALVLLLGMLLYKLQRQAVKVAGSIFR